MADYKIGDWFSSNWYSGFLTQRIGTSPGELGIDLAPRSGKVGDTISAGLNGVVTKVVDKYPGETPNLNGGWGNYVQLDVGNGFTVTIGHLLKTFVHMGDRVTTGQVIGRLGNSGNSTNPHTELTVSQNGKFVDPVNFLQLGSDGKQRNITSDTANLANTVNDWLTGGAKAVNSAASLGDIWNSLNSTVRTDARGFAVRTGTAITLAIIGIGLLFVGFLSILKGGKEND